jgi:DNA-binding response OmpR family regulator
MNVEPIKVLLIEDNPGDARLISEILSEETSARFSLEHVRRLEEGLERLDSGGSDVVLLDLSLPDSFGIDTFHQVVERATQVPVIVLTALDNQDVAVEVLQGGGQDYLVKTYLNYAVLHRSIRHAIERKRAEGELRRVRETAEEACRAKDKFLALVCGAMGSSLQPVLSRIVELTDDPSTPAGIVPDLTIIRRHLELEERLIAGLGKIDLDELAGRG